jgi:hypothetical protein
MAVIEQANSPCEESPYMQNMHVCKRCALQVIAWQRGPTVYQKKGVMAACPGTASDDCGLGRHGNQQGVWKPGYCRTFSTLSDSATLLTPAAVCVEKAL